MANRSPSVTGRKQLFKQDAGISVVFSNKDPEICGGEPVITGTRVTLRTVLATLAEGADVEEVVEEFPTVTEQQVRDTIAFAAQSTEEDLPYPGASTSV